MKKYSIFIYLFKVKVQLKVHESINDYSYSFATIAKCNRIIAKIFAVYQNYQNYLEKDKWDFKKS